jgi:hypothetical protein
MSLTESIVEDAALEWFGELGYAVGHGPQLAPGERLECVELVEHPFLQRRLSQDDVGE